MSGKLLKQILDEAKLVTTDFSGLTVEINGLKKEQQITNERLTNIELKGNLLDIVNNANLRCDYPPSTCPPQYFATRL